VWTYLGYRLGLDPGRVPRPTTRVVGIQALGYFDPPPREGKQAAKPILVATTPCAVFEQIDRDGNVHAHRVYLAKGGLGKADLGIDANGKPRVPKKSAKIIGDDNTSGRSVRWGDPLTATLAILCEGVETASAVALAFQAEIKAGEILVVACINAAGIENFKPWPQTKAAIVAADRDEAADGGRALSRRGERAAREFGIRHHPDFAGEAALPVSIALPGMPGDAVDWLDTLRRDGIAAVRTGILGGAAYTPTTTEIERQRGRAAPADGLKEVIETYPLPDMDSLRVEFRYTRSSEIWVHKFAGEKSEKRTTSKTENWAPVVSPMGVSALLQMANDDEAYGLRVVVQDMSGQPRIVDSQRGELD